MAMIDNDLLAEDGQVGGDLKFIGTVNTLPRLPGNDAAAPAANLICRFSICVSLQQMHAEDPESADTNIYCIEMVSYRACQHNTLILSAVSQQC